MQDRRVPSQSFSRGRNQGSSQQRPKSEFQKVMEEGLKKSDNRMDKFEDSLKLILRKLEEKDSLAGYTEEEEFDIGILTQEEIVHFYDR